MSTEGGSSTFEDADKGLKQHVTLTQLILLGVSAQIGSAWLFGVLAAAHMAGPAAILSWLIAGALVFGISLTYLELGAMLPRSGGIVRYTYLSHGQLSGWIIGWAYWLSVVSIPALEAIAALTYVGGKYPWLNFVHRVNGTPMLMWPNGILVGLALMILFFCLNYFGSKLLAESNQYVTYWKIALPTVTFIALFFIADKANFGSYGGFFYVPVHGDESSIAAVFHAIPTAGVIFSLLGFRQALDYGGEAVDPPHDVPIATFFSILIPTIIYVLLQIAFIGAINWADAGIPAGHWHQLLSSDWADGPLFHALEAAQLPLMAAIGTLLLIDAAVSPLASGWVYLGTGARTGYGLAIHESIPSKFAESNTHGIPWVPLILSAVVGALFFLPAPSWYKLVGFISSAAVLSYVMGGIGVPVLRKTAPDLPRPFHLHWIRIFAPISFLSAVIILYWSGFKVLTNVFAASFIGLPMFTLYFTRHKKIIKPVIGFIIGIGFFAVFLYVLIASGWVLSTKPGAGDGDWTFVQFFASFGACVIAFCLATWIFSDKRGKQHVISTIWLIWLSLGSMAVGYLGVYGPEIARISTGGDTWTTRLAFPWGIVAEIGVGIVAYIIGIYTGFETEEIKDINRLNAEANAEDPQELEDALAEAE